MLNKDDSILIMIDVQDKLVNMLDSENKEKAIEKAKQAVAVICNKYPIKY